MKNGMSTQSSTILVDPTMVQEVLYMFTVSLVSFVAVTAIATQAILR